jgi:hypothetical protein
VEARGGDVLARDVLLELLGNERALRVDSEVGPLLLRYPDPRLRGAEAVGTATLADAVDLALAEAGGLEEAPPQAVERIVARLIDAAGPEAFSLSADARRDEASGTWSASSLLVVVLSDNEALGGGGLRTTLGTDDTTKEER